MSAPDDAWETCPVWGTWRPKTPPMDPQPAFGFRLLRAIREATDEEIEDALAAQTLMENDQ